MLQGEGHPKSGFPLEAGSPGRPEPDLEPNLDLRPIVPQLHDIAGTQIDDAGDALVVDVRAIPAAEVDDDEPDASVVAGHDARVVPADGGVALGIEPHGGGRRPAEDQLTMRTERDDVGFGRA